jgi:TetR/AcrR family fatty acid metabolism transcriptional regulator
MAIVYQAETRQKKRIVEEQIKVMAKMYYDLIAEIIELGQQDGSIRKELYVGLVKRSILGSVDEVINTWLHSNSTYDLVSMTEPLVDLFIRGIGMHPRHEE